MGLIALAGVGLGVWAIAIGIAFNLDTVMFGGFLAALACFGLLEVVSVLRAKADSGRRVRLVDPRPDFDEIEIRWPEDRAA